MSVVVGVALCASDGLLVVTHPAAEDRCLAVPHRRGPTPRYPQNRRSGRVRDRQQPDSHAFRHTSRRRSSASRTDIADSSGPRAITTVFSTSSPTVSGSDPNTA